MQGGHFRQRNGQEEPGVLRGLSHSVGTLEGGREAGEV